MQICGAIEAHVLPLMDVVRECIAEMRRAGIDQWDEIYPDRATFLQDLHERTLFIAADGDAIAGAYVLNECQNEEYREVPWTIDAQRIAVVHRLLVSPRCQRKGIASMMVVDAERRAAAAGYDAIRLDAFTLNPTALRLYQRHGYHDAGAMRLRKGLFRGFEKAIRPTH